MILRFVSYDQIRVSPMRLPGRANRPKCGMSRKAAATDERKRMTVLKEIEKRGIEDGRDKETRALTERGA
ncbi:hypothetical protein Bca4012_002003 [Brassica carinata]